MPVCVCNNGWTGDYCTQVASTTPIHNCYTHDFPLSTGVHNITLDDDSVMPLVCDMDAW